MVFSDSGTYVKMFFLGEDPQIADKMRALELALDAEQRVVSAMTFAQVYDLRDKQNAMYGAVKTMVDCTLLSCVCSRPRCCSTPTHSD
jgi:hypothetical protein